MFKSGTAILQPLFLFSSIIQKFFAMMKNLHLFWLVISVYPLSQMLNLKGFISTLKSIKIIKIQKTIMSFWKKASFAKILLAILPPKLKRLNLIGKCLNRELLSCNHYFCVFHNNSKVIFQGEKSPSFLTGNFQLSIYFIFLKKMLPSWTSIVTNVEFERL